VTLFIIKISVVSNFLITVLILNRGQQLTILEERFKATLSVRVTQNHPLEPRVTVTD